MTVDIPSQKRRYWLLTMPRTASNMLVRVLNLDEQNVRPALHGGYFFFPSVLARIGLHGKPIQEWTAEDYATVEAGTRQSVDALQDHLEAAEAEGQKIFVKEHTSFLNSLYFELEYSFGKADDRLLETVPMRGFPESTRSSLNLTSLPDEFLKTWLPTFLIRHPAMMFPSLFRTAKQKVQMNGKGRAQPEPYEIEATMKFIRALYEFYANHFGPGSSWPIVLDADDVITDPQIVMKYAEMVDLEPEKLQFSWEKTSQEKLDKLDPAEKIMLGTINASTGLDKSKLAGNIDIGAEAEKWKSEFGEEGGSKLERWVRAAMPDYEYLRSKRLTLG